MNIQNVSSTVQLVLQTAARCKRTLTVMHATYMRLLGSVVISDVA